MSFLSDVRNAVSSVLDPAGAIMTNGRIDPAKVFNPLASLSAVSTYVKSADPRAGMSTALKMTPDYYVGSAVISKLKSAGLYEQATSLITASADPMTIAAGIKSLADSAVVNPVGAIIEKTGSSSNALATAVSGTLSMDPVQQIISGPTGTVGDALTITRKTIVNTAPNQGLALIQDKGLMRGGGEVIKQSYNPVTASGEKVMVGSYDITGTRAMEKTVVGAASGFVTGGPYGALAGGVAANFQQGEANFVQDAAIGAVAGVAAGYEAGTGLAGEIVEGGSALAGATSYVKPAAALLGLGGAAASGGSASPPKMIQAGMFGAVDPMMALIAAAIVGIVTMLVLGKGK